MSSRERGHFFMAYIRGEAREQTTMFPATLDELIPVDHTNNPMPKDPAAGAARWQDPNVREIQMQMERALGVRVRINDRNGKGRIVIEYATLEDFDRVVETLKGSG